MHYASSKTVTKVSIFLKSSSTKWLLVLISLQAVKMHYSVSLSKIKEKHSHSLSFSIITITLISILFVCNHLYLKKYKYYNNKYNTFENDSKLGIIYQPGADPDLVPKNLNPNCTDHEKTRPTTWQLKVE